MKPNMPKTPFSMSLSGSAKETELRIRNIFQWKKKRPPVIALVAAVLVVVFCGSLVGFTPVESEQKQQEIVDTVSWEELYEHYAAEIDPEFCNDPDDVVNQLAVIIPPQVMVNQYSNVSNYELIQIAQRAIHLAYSQELVDSWETERGYEVPIQAIQAMMNRIIWTSNNETIHLSPEYDSETQTLALSKDGLKQLSECSVVLLDEPVHFVYATASLQFASRGKEYHGEDVYEYVFEVTTGGNTYRRPMIVVLEDGIKLSSVSSTSDSVRGSADSRCVFVTYDSEQPDIVEFTHLLFDGDGRDIITFPNYELTESPYRLASSCVLQLLDSDNEIVISDPSEITQYQNSPYGFLCWVQISNEDKTIVKMKELDAERYAIK